MAGGKLDQPEVSSDGGSDADLGPPDGDGIQSFLTYRLSLLQKKLDHRSTRLLVRDFGLRLNEWRVLANVARKHGSSVRVIAKRISIDKSQISRALGGLIRMELVIRNADPQDARSPLFSLTDAGTAMRDRVMAARRAEQALLLGVVGPAEREVLFSVIARLDGFLDRIGLLTDASEPDAGSPARRDGTGR